MRVSVLFVLCSLACFLSACDLKKVADENLAIAENQWTYNQPLKLNYHITDTIAAYRFNFKLRLTNDYRYSNLFVLSKFKHKNQQKTLRYQFQLAKADGQWLGKGSGNLYSYVLPLQHAFKFADTGRYEIVVEQNMRDNPLLGISDVGLEVIKLP